MSPISLSLDLLLMLLLVAALGFGWRLERRLKALRESHADFAGAVADLDRAAQRAEVGLAQLRQATDEAVDLLAGRIEKAREMASRLETLTQRAAQAPSRIAVERPDVATPANIKPVSNRPANIKPANDATRPANAAARSPAAQVRSPVDAVLAAEALARRLSGDESLVLRDHAPTMVRPMRRPAPSPRPAIDDDLFEAPARLAAGAGPRGR
jgi:hypothetical protein